MVVSQKKPGIGLRQLLKVLPLHVSLIQDAPASDAADQNIQRGLKIDHKIRGRRFGFYELKDLLIEMVLLGRQGQACIQRVFLEHEIRDTDRRYEQVALTQLPKPLCTLEQEVQLCLQGMLLGVPVEFFEKGVLFGLLEHQRTAQRLADAASKLGFAYPDRALDSDELDYTANRISPVQKACLPDCFATRILRRFYTGHPPVDNSLARQMKLLFDLFPLIVFFGIFKFYDIFLATAAAIVATFIQVGFFWAKHRRFETVHILTLVIITVFGGLTILLKDDIFIKWKPTIINWLFSGIITAMLLFARKSALEYIMGGQISLPAPVWRNLNWAWAAFFAILGTLNLYVAFYYNLDADPERRTEIWVNFKVFWMLGLTMAFAVLQMIYLARHIKIEEEQ